MSRPLLLLMRLALPAGLLIAITKAPMETPGKLPTEPEKPTPVTLKGRIVCLADEMKERWKAEVPPVHEHLLGFKVEKPAAQAVAYYTLLRTPLSEALFVDKRFEERTLKLTGRAFPGTAILEVASSQWFRDETLFDVYYWCEVCSIQSANPGPCACCQGKVELREAEARERAR